MILLISSGFYVHIVQVYMDPCYGFAKPKNLAGICTASGKGVRTVCGLPLTMHSGLLSMLTLSLPLLDELFRRFTKTQTIYYTDFLETCCRHAG